MNLCSFFGENFPEKLETLEKLMWEAGVNYNVNKFSQLLLLLRIQKDNQANLNVLKEKIKNKGDSKENENKTGKDKVKEKEIDLIPKKKLPFKNSVIHIAIAFAIHIQKVFFFFIKTNII